MIKLIYIVITIFIFCIKNTIRKYEKKGDDMKDSILVELKTYGHCGDRRTFSLLIKDLSQ